MTFLDEHIAWIEGLGQSVLPFDAVPPIPGLRDDLPDEIDLWFRQRMPHRAVDWTPIGISGEYAGAWMTPEYDSEYPLFAEPGPRTLKAVELGVFPEQPVGFADFVNDVWTVQTKGPRAGWIYSNDFQNPQSGVDFIAKSLSQLFYAVRTLTSIGLIDPTDHHFKSKWNPPPDTPWNMVGNPFGGPIGKDYDPPRTHTQPPIADSIRDLLPDFDFDFDTT